MKLKHVKLFENFDLSEADSSAYDKEITFDFLAFDAKVDDPEVKSVPEELGVEEAYKYCQEHPEVKDLGLFIAHDKMPSGGFNRFIISSTNPLLIDAATFDEKFKLIKENLKAKPEELVDLKSFSLGTDVFKRFGAFDKDEEDEGY